jgi:amidohydrolase
MLRAAQQIDQLTEQVLPYVTGWRHWLHRHPELPNREVRTAAYVARHLRALKLDEVRTSVAGHGVVGVLRGARRGDRVMALRAGIDALPGGPFQVAHACGHDCHTAMLMGAAAVLAQLRDDLAGTVLFVFQPAEDGPPPDEPGGAALMEAEGALCDPVPTMVYSHHVAPLPIGYVGYRTGNQYGAGCLLKIVVTGDRADPVPAAARIICAMGELYRGAGAFDPITISIGHLEDTGRFNITGDHVTLWGTVRCMAEPDMPRVQRVIARTAGNTAQAYGCSARTDFRQDVPAVHNDPAWVDAALPTLRAVAGRDRVVRTPTAPGYDDVSVFVNKYGGLYVMLGCQDGEYAEDGELRPVPGGRGLVPNHDPAFYADDTVLPTGVRLHAGMAAGHLSGAVTA